MANIGVLFKVDRVTKIKPGEMYAAMLNNFVLPLRISFFIH